MIRVCRFYFPPNSTKEILEEVRPMLCPFDMIMQRAMVYLELFLPTALMPDQEEIGWRLWKDEMLGEHIYWNTCLFIAISSNAVVRKNLNFHAAFTTDASSWIDIWMTSSI